ncbi:MAG: hypothetical protein NVS3B14_23690 [Ktedonobacteraceae bacterium]
MRIICLGEQLKVARPQSHRVFAKYKSLLRRLAAGTYLDPKW